MNAPPVTGVLNTLPDVASCASITLDISASTGGALRELRPTWTLMSSLPALSNSTIDTINAYANSINGSSHATHPPGDLGTTAIRVLI